MVYLVDVNKRCDIYTIYDTETYTFKDIERAELIKDLQQGLAIGNFDSELFLKDTNISVMYTTNTITHLYTKKHKGKNGCFISDSDIYLVPAYKFYETCLGDGLHYKNMEFVYVVSDRQYFFIKIDDKSCVLMLSESKPDQLLVVNGKVTHISVVYVDDMMYFGIDSKDGIWTLALTSLVTIKFYPNKDSIDVRNGMTGITSMYTFDSGMTRNQFKRQILLG